MNTEDNETFYTFLVKEQYFKRTDKRLSRIKSATPYIIGLLATIVVTTMAHYLSVEGSNETTGEADTIWAKAFVYLVGVIGDKGIWTIGILVSCFWAYQICRIFKSTNSDKIFPATS